MPILLDVTLREAGIANRFSFSLTQAGSIAAALDRAGVDVIEVGYLRPALAALSGASCAPLYLDTVLRSCTRASVAVMIHLPDVTLGCYKELAARGVSLVRFAVSPADLDGLARHVDALLAAGLSFTVNATRATELPPEQILKTAVCAERMLARCFYIADSNGSLYPDRVESLIRMLRAYTSLPLGFHAHDNLRLAFANALAALRNGVEWLDASLGGAGKGGGNLIAELAAGHIALRDGRPLDIFAMAHAFATYVAPTLENGPSNYLPGLLYGLLDFSLDRIAEVTAECERRKISLEDLLAELYYRNVDDRARNEAIQPVIRRSEICAHLRVLKG